MNLSTKHYFISLRVFILFLALILKINCYGWRTPFQLWDLESTTDAAFKTEVAPWSCTRLVNNAVKHSNCGGNFLMGGFNVMGGDGIGGANPSYGQYFYRTYNSLIPPHNQLNLTFTVFPIDSWDGTTADDHFKVDADGTVIDGWHFSGFAGYTMPLCGGSWDEFPPVRVYMTLPHQALSLTLKFISYLNQNSQDESMGIREIQMDFVNMTTPEISVCGRSNGTPLPNRACPCNSTKEFMRPPNSGTCFPCHLSCKTCTEETLNDCTSCDPGFYLNSATKGKCLPCHPTCATCTGGNANQCLTCTNNWFLVVSTCYPTCNYPLYNQTIGGINHCYTPCPSQFAFWDASCSTQCPSPPYIQTINNTYSLCNYPCKETEHLYWNNSCLASCPFPLDGNITRDRNYCNFPCQSNEFLYWNGSCRNACQFPLVTRTEGTPLRRFCDYPCTGGDYLYWNGSCISDCKLPLIQRIDAGDRYCDYLCPSTGVIYWDGYCSNDCVNPLIRETHGSPITRDFCFYPCPINQILYWNGTCSDICDFPLVSDAQHSRQFCNNPCSAGQFLYWNGSCIAGCDFPLKQRTEPGVDYCDYPCTGGDHLYWNGSCISTCDSPLTPRIEANKLYCDFLCSPSTDFLFWDKDCNSTCNFPLTSVPEGNPIVRSFCKYHCQDNEYLYWNGSCFSQCEFPLTTSIFKGKNFCHYPCATNEFLYWNGSCLPSCDFPLPKRIDTSNHQFCDFPCKFSEYLFLEWLLSKQLQLSSRKHRDKSS